MEMARQFVTLFDGSSAGHAHTAPQLACTDRRKGSGLGLWNGVVATDSQTPSELLQLGYIVTADDKHL